MNEITKLFSDEQVTMDSREIAELTGKEHRNILADIRNQLGSLPGGVLKFQQSYFNEQKKEQPSFKLPYRETMILISGYSVELRTKIIDRWIVLESNVRLPKTFAEALRLAADQAEQIEVMKPKALSYDQFLSTDGYQTMNEVAKMLGIGPNTMMDKLREHKVLTPDNLPYQQYMCKGFKVIDNVKNSFKVSSTVVDSKGIEYIKIVLGL